MRKNRFICWIYACSLSRCGILNRTTTHHVVFDLLRHLFVFNVQVLHGLVLGLFGTKLNLLYLRGVFRIGLRDGGDLASLLLIDGRHCAHYVCCRHEFIDCLTLRERLLTLDGYFHDLL